jgi:hypothetical protein
MDKVIIKKIHKGYWMCWSGVDKKERAKGGVGLTIAPKRLIDIVNQKYINERMLRMEVKLLGEDIWSLFIVYGVNPLDDFCVVNSQRSLTPHIFHCTNMHLYHCSPFADRFN